MPQPIPVIPIPLRSGEADVDLDLQVVLNRVYEKARFGQEIDYHQPPVPSVSEDIQTWITELLCR